MRLNWEKCDHKRGEWWTYRSGRLEAVVVKDHLMYPGGYLLMAPLLGFEHKFLIGTELEQVLESAEFYMAEAADELIKSLEEVCR